jgi:nucleotide-binding universal stress UspA family protein
VSDTPAARTLLFGDDGSPASDVAFSWIDHQPWPGWHLHVLHAEAPPYGKPLPEAEAAPHPWQPPALRVPSPTTGFDGVEHLLARADPRIALLEPADLVVVGPHGHGRLKTLALGSVSEWLLTRPPSPTVIARHGDAVRSILLAHDGSAAADHTARALGSLPLMHGATCTVVVVDDGRVHVERAVEAARAALAPSGVDPEVVVHQGAPTAAIAGEIDRRRPELAALGTRGLTGLRRFHLGSTASAIARSAPCSVLVACAETDDHPGHGAGG